MTRARDRAATEECRSPEHLAWHLGTSHALAVVKRGRMVLRATPETAADCAEG